MDEVSPPDYEVVHQHPTMRTFDDTGDVGDFYFDEPWWMVWVDRGLKGAIFILVAILAAVAWSLFSTENYTAHVILAKSVLSEQECTQIIQAAEGIAASRATGWEVFCVEHQLNRPRFWWHAAHIVYLCS